MNSKKIFIIASLGVTSILTLSLSFYAYEKYVRVLPEQAYIAGQSLSGLNRVDAFEKIQEYTQSLQNRKYTITLHENVQREFSISELGITYDPIKTLAQVFNHHRWFARANSEGPAAVTHKPVVTYDEAIFQQTLKDFLLSPEKDYQNAEIAWSEKNWFIQPQTPGLIMKSGELERIAAEIKKNAEEVMPTESLQVAYESVDAPRKTSDLEPLLKIIQDRVGKSVLLSMGKEKTELSLGEYQDWIRFDVVEQTVGMNEPFAADWVKNYARERDVAPGNAIITAIEEHVSEYDGKPFKRAVYSGNLIHGKTIDQQKIMEALKSMIEDPGVERKITVEWEDLLPTITSQVEGYSFPQILSTGISSYRYGNHPNRVKNIKLSLESFQGVVLDPGEEFSFNRVTGWITPNKGYTKTQVIMEGRVEEGVGGGVCQSSTTMYRSILNAGAQVTERRNHTLDIIYYHQYGYGLDATVYTDSRNDLKFVNNFPGPIIINTFTDDASAEAVVEFYGTTDDRYVELTQINTGDYLLKKWNWKIVWPDRVEEQIVQSRYQLPKEEEKPANPLEG
ncbi:MAG: VanW family protein [Candidatus Altimarinota bacterium]